MSDFVSIDEFLSHRKGATKNGVLFKASRPKAPPSWNGETRTARFVMSAQVEDRDHDIVVTAGIDTKNFVNNPVALLNHRSDQPIGTWPKLYKLPKSLEGDIVISDDEKIPEATRAAALIGAGLVRAASIGFIPKSVKRVVMENGEPARLWEVVECELVECSIVTIPANPMALAKGAAGGDELALCRDLIEEVLDTYAKDPATGLIVPKAEFEAAHGVISPAKTTVVFDAAGDAPLPKRFIDKIKDAIALPGVAERVEAEAQAVLAAEEAQAKALADAKKAAYAALAGV